MAQVKLILKDDVPNLGDAGDLVSVRPGYARNYLVPQGKAIPATAGKVKELEHHQRVIAEQMARALKDLQGVRDRIQSRPIEVTARAGEEGKLFGSVTAQQIADLLAERGIEIDRRKIQLSEPIKEVGDHDVPVRLHRELTATVKVVVTADGAPVPTPEPEPFEADESDPDHERESYPD